MRLRKFGQQRRKEKRRRRRRQIHQILPELRKPSPNGKESSLMRRLV
jgi:hypothetical protein